VKTLEVTDREELELAAAERAAVEVLAGLVLEGFDVDDALELVGFPSWPGEE
jgi:hypothetical protein